MHAEGFAGDDPGLRPPRQGERRLLNHRARGSMPMGAGCAVLFGIPFAVAGVFILGISQGWVEAQTKNAPDQVIAGAGLIFLLAGLSVIGSGLWRWKERLAMQARARERPGDPWYGDHSWDEAASHDSAAANMLKGFVTVAFLAVFLLPFNWWAFYSGEGEAMVTFLVSFFDLFLAGAVLYFLYLVLRWLKYGASRFEFSRFPFPLGESLEGRLVVDSPVEAESLSCTLRCVQERWEVHGHGRNRSKQVVAYELYAQERELTLGPIREDAEDFSVQIAFPLPDSPGLSTRLSEDEARYWEVVFDAETPGVDFHAVFLVPVYARP